MTVTIKRETIFYGGFTRLQIYINGEKVNSISKPLRLVKVPSILRK